MKKKLRLVAFASAALALSSGGILIACSDDTSVDPGKPDGGDASKIDSPVTDGGVDAADAADAADVQVPDSGYDPVTFTKAIGKALCLRLADCCFGDPNLADNAPLDGGGTYLRATCENYYETDGLAGSNLGTAALDGGNVELDHAKANECLAAIAALTCEPTPNSFVAARQACFGALKGKLTTGTCKDGMECAQGYFCNRPTSDASGTCTALRPLNGPCGDFTTDPSVAPNACSWRSGGDTARHCSTMEADAADWKCVGSQPPGSDCQDHAWCASGFCSNSLLGKCVSSTPLTDTIFHCPTFINNP